VRKVLGIHGSSDSEFPPPYDGFFSPKQLELHAQGAVGFWRDLPVKLLLDYRLSAPQEAAIAEAATQWNEAAGRELLQIAGRDSEIPPSLNEALEDGRTGLYLVPNLPNSLMGRTTWEHEADASIARADVIFNDDCYTLQGTGDAAVKDGTLALSLHALALHELGHLLGLAHIAKADDRDSAMLIYYRYDLQPQQPSPGDRERLRALYSPDAPIPRLDFPLSPHLVWSSVEAADEIPPTHPRKECR